MRRTDHGGITSPSDASASTPGRRRQGLVQQSLHVGRSNRLAPLSYAARFNQAAERAQPFCRFFAARRQGSNEPELCRLRIHGYIPSRSDELMASISDTAGDDCAILIGSVESTGPL